MFRPMLQLVSISDSTPSLIYFRNVSPNVAACVHLWFHSIILLEKCFPQGCSVCPSLIPLHHSTSEMFRPMLQLVSAPDSTPSLIHFRNVSPNVAACVHLWFHSIIILQKCFAQCSSLCPSPISLHHSTSEMFRPMLQLVSISDFTPSFYFRNVSPSVAVCVHPWFHSIILLQKCFAQCCSLCPSLIPLHHSTSEMFRPVLQCVHPWFHSIILFQKCFAKCCSLCPLLIRLHH